MEENKIESGGLAGLRKLREKEKESSRKPTKVIPTSISKPNYATEALEEWRIKE